MKEKLHFATEQEYLDYINHLPQVAEGIRLKNFSRVQIVEEDGRIVGGDRGGAFRSSQERR